MSAPSPPSMISFPFPALIVVAKFGAVMDSFPVVPLIVTVSEPLVKVLAVKFKNEAVVPDPTLIIKLDVPAAISDKRSVSSVN